MLLLNIYFFISYTWISKSEISIQLHQIMVTLEWNTVNYFVYLHLIIINKSSISTNSYTKTSSTSSIKGNKMCLHLYYLWLLLSTMVVCFFLKGSLRCNMLYNPWKNSTLLSKQNLKEFSEFHKICKNQNYQSSYVVINMPSCPCAYNSVTLHRNNKHCYTSREV